MSSPEEPRRYDPLRRLAEGDWVAYGCRVEGCTVEGPHKHDEDASA